MSWEYKEFLETKTKSELADRLDEDDMRDLVVECDPDGDNDDEFQEYMWEARHLHMR